MTNNEFRKKAYTILGGLVFVLIVLACTTAVWANEPKSRFIPPVYLEVGEEDDGKYAEMINKGMLCDMMPLVLRRFDKRGFIPVIQSQSASGFKTVIYMKHAIGDDGATPIIEEMAIIEFPPAVDVACVAFEGQYTRFINTKD